MKITRESLKARLLKSGVPLDLWGKNQAKTLDHLVEELNIGESKLQGIERIIHTVVLDVRYKKFVLREKEQVFVSGRYRKRRLPWGSVAEKLRPGEGVFSGIKRALKEELGIDFGYGVRLRQVRGVELVGVSLSYPGLVNTNFQSRFVVTLPTRLFKEEGYVEIQPDKTTYFEWTLK